MHRIDPTSRLALLGALCVALATGACITTDDPPPRDGDGFTDYQPDMDADPSPDTPEDARDQGAPSGDMPEGPDMPGSEDPDMPGGPDMGPRVCQPNYDGRITRQEVPLREGLYATFEVALDATVDTAGEPLEGGADGERSWDLTGDLNRDERVLVETLDPTGRWFSTDFPEASYVTRLSQEHDLLGVFELTDDALLLLGVVSPEEGFDVTNLEYDPPVVVLDFPLEEGKSWSTDASVSGTAQGVLTIGSEEYTSQVDASGELVTPYGTFPVLRVRTELDRQVNLWFTSEIRTYAFVSECFGSVATIRSKDNEDEVEFTEAAEVRRLTR